MKTFSFWRWVITGLVITTALRSEDSRIQAITARQEPIWPQTPTRISLQPYGGLCDALEFSPSGDFLCAWWLPPPPLGDYLKLPGRAAVFDLQGNFVTEATNNQGELVGKYASMFPDIAWRWRFWDFVKDSEKLKVRLWGFTNDYSAGIRFLKEPQDLSEVGTAQYWVFGQPDKMVWSRDITGSVQKRGIVGFYQWGNENLVLLALHGRTGYVLAQTDGKLVDTFGYGKEETEADLLARKRKFHLAGDSDDVSIKFSPWVFAFEPARRLLACGDFESRRLRVVSVEPPYRVVFEANTDDNSQSPRGGVWGVSSAFFDGGGKYLVVGYKFGGRLTDKYYEPVEIFETETWRLVYTINTPDIFSRTSPRISPDGKKLALKRGEILEIGDFVPQLPLPKGDAAQNR